MYEENRNQGFDGNVTPDDHRSEESMPNFTMRETERPEAGKEKPEETGNPIQSQAGDSSQPSFGQSQQNSGYQSQTAPVQAPNQQQYQGGFMGSQVPPQNHSPFGNTNGGAYGAGGQNMNGQGTNGQNGQYMGSYQSNPYGPSGSNPGVSVNRKEARKARKKGGMVRKAAGITAAALLFGVISGGTMVGVNMLADSMKEETYPEVSQAGTVDQAPETQESLPPDATRPDTPQNRSQASSALALDVSAIVENAMPSIVAINNTMLYQSNSWFGPSQTYEVPSSGSGIIVGQNDEELLIVTNNHVVEDANTLSVVFIDSTSVDAAIKGTDADSDLAVVAVPLKDIPADTLSQISVATLGNSDDLKVGQGVIAIGNALGYGQSVTVGWVSALDREVTTQGTTTRNLLQTDAAINPGNSGGALLNMKGEVIGINAAKYSSTDVEGIGYAIPISKAQDIINSLMTKRTRSNAVEEGKEGYLGIQGLTVDDSMARQLGMPSGVFVSGIIEGGAASKTDLREKDIITKFDDQTVRTMASLQELLKYYKAGETVNITVQSLENGQYVERNIEITLEGKDTLGETSNVPQVPQGRQQGK